jgi:hypothetical protein
LTEKESDRAREGLEACGIVTLQVRLAVEKSSGVPQALLVKKGVPAQYDEALKDAAEALLRPKEYTDAQFGKFTLDRQLNRYSTTTEWNGKELSLDLETVSSDDDEFPQQALECARAFWQDREEWTRKVNAKILSALLELKNTMWLHEDESPLSQGEFLGCLIMHSISITPKGSFSLWYGDGDVFAGHSISVRGSLAEGVRRASLEG